MSDFGLQLKAKREGRGFTQIALSKLLDRKGMPLDHTTISRWETGDRSLSPKYRDQVIAIADVLGMTEDEKNHLIVSAGLAPLQPEELDIDKILDSLGPGRWHKTYFLHKNVGWEERKIGDKLGIAFWEVQNDIEKAEEEKRRQELEFIEVVQELTIQPGHGLYFNVSLPANTILIERIIVRPSDTDATFELKIFDRLQDAGYPGVEDLVWEGSSDGGRLTWVPVRLEPYRDEDGSRRLYGGIILHKRHVRFDMVGQELKDYLQRPVTFKVTLRYKTLP